MGVLDKSLRFCSDYGSRPNNNCAGKFENWFEKFFFRDYCRFSEHFIFLKVKKNFYVKKFFFSENCPKSCITVNVSKLTKKKFSFAKKTFLKKIFY